VRWGTAVDAQSTGADRKTRYFGDRCTAAEASGWLWPTKPLENGLVPVAYRTSLSGFVPVSGIVAFRGVDKAE
jgi:hypothetical protein